MAEVLKGSRVGELPRPNRTYSEGRVCAENDCETKLSVYNRSSFCWQHTPLRYPVVRGDRKKNKKRAAA